MNIKNGLQVLVLIAGLIFTLIVVMTLLSCTDHPIPPSFQDAFFALIGALTGGTAVHLSAKVNNSSGGPSGPPVGAAPSGRPEGPS